MALIKKNELRNMTKEQMEHKIEDLNKDMLKINVQRATKTTIESPGRVKQIKKTIAMLLTRIHAQKTKEVKKKI
ncbi:MAG: 50S ribosomal protein L29 [Candidatus Nanoarchaeia archaeon]|nr:50S ribosomal protein L29 [Candidatus Nanoarchaeia archaeon]